MNFWILFFDFCPKTISKFAAISDALPPSPRLPGGVESIQSSGRRRDAPKLFEDGDCHYRNRTVTLYRTSVCNAVNTLSTEPAPPSAQEPGTALASTHHSHGRRCSSEGRRGPECCGPTCSSNKESSNRTPRTCSLPSAVLRAPAPRWPWDTV